MVGNCWLTASLAAWTASGEPEKAYTGAWLSNCLAMAKKLKVTELNCWDRPHTIEASPGGNWPPYFSTKSLLPYEAISPADWNPRFTAATSDSWLGVAWKSRCRALTCFRDASSRGRDLAFWFRKAFRGVRPNSYPNAAADLR